MSHLARATSAFIGSALALATAGASATAVIGAIGITSPQGDFGGANALANIINQSSLSAGYTSGVTNFAVYTAATTSGQLTGAGFTATESNGPQQFTFDLGALFDIDGVAVWNTNSVGAITRFEMYADNDDDFSNGVGALILGPSSLATNSASADVFSFGSTQTRYVHLQGLASLAPPDFYGLNEVVFRGQAAGTQVPEPASLGLAALALAAAGAASRRRAG